MNTARAAFLLCFCLPAAARAHLERYEFQRPQMGVPFSITLYADSQEKADAAAGAAFARASALNAVLSDYEPDSELSRLSRSSGSGRDVPVSPELWRMLSLGQDMARRSDGALDITVGPVVDLWRRARRSGKMPKPEKLAAALAVTGHGKVTLDAAARTARLAVTGMRLDLGGIAKGYVVDEAMAVLKAKGVTSALVAAGGDIAASSAPPGRDGWRVMTTALDTPDAPEARVVLLKNSAISTSGDTHQRVEIDGVRYSHIVDPKTGLGLTDHSLVTVLGPDATTTDSLETTISVTGPFRGLALIAATPGTAVHVIRRPGEKIETFQSPNWEEMAGK